MLAHLPFFAAASLIFGTGFNQLGGIRIAGPNGLDRWGAFQFQDLCTSTPRPGLKQCWQIKVILNEPIAGFKPDYWGEWPVEAWGTAAGHMFLRVNGDSDFGVWTVEMIPLDETLRQTISWEAETMGFKPNAHPGSQRIDISIGRDTLLITGTKR